MPERRNASRVPLDVPCLLTMHIEHGNDFAVLLTDISTGGVQLAMAPGVSPQSLANSRVTLHELPQSLQALEKSSGKIVWTSNKHCGVRLDEQLNITIDEIARLAHTATLG